MACLRCHGFVYYERLAKDGLFWWRCVNCGDRIDDVILRHRAEQEAELALRREDQERDMKEWAAWFAKVPA